MALREIDESKQKSFITVDAWRNEEEKEYADWNLTALTYMSTENWKKEFKNNNYRGDYYWFIAVKTKLLQDQSI